MFRTMAPKVQEQTYWRPETQEAAWEPSGVTGKGKHSACVLPPLTSTPGTPYSELQGTVCSPLRCVQL